MKPQNTKFEKVQDLVNWLTESPYRTNEKYSLSSWSHKVWDDEEAGKAWNKEYYALPMVWRHNFEHYTEDGHHYTFDETGYREAEKAYDTAQDEIISRCPSEHIETTWTLEKARGSSIALAEEMGQLLDSTWTKRTSRYSSLKERVGMLTVGGMLKRLKADKGLNEAINAAKAAADHQQEVNRINSARSQIRRYAKEIVGLVEQAKLGDESEQISILLNNLVVLQEQEL